jgi:AAA family ATP:ADP antiporter
MLEPIKERFFDLKRDEWPRALALSFFFFLVIAVFWVLKPIKKGALISFYKEEPLRFLGITFAGAEVEQLAKVVNMIVVYGVVVLFTIMVRHFKRQQVVYIFCVLISILLAVFAYAVAQPDPLTAWSFYVFGDIFNSIMVATFWAFTNDVNTPGQSKRLYGIIGLGGVVGGAVGATFVSTLVDVEGARELLGRAPADLNLPQKVQRTVLSVLFPIYEQVIAFFRQVNEAVGITGFDDQMMGRTSLILLCIVAMALIAAIAYYVHHRAGRSDTPETASDEPDNDDEEKRSTMSAALEGARLVFQSKYLLAILAIIGLYEMVSNVIEFQLSASVETSAMQGPDIDAFFGTYGLLISVVSISAQLFVTPYVMNRWSVGAALIILPIVDLILSAGFLLVPVLYMAAALSIGDNGLYYSIMQSAKESLYTPTSRDEKYKAKAFIDMFIQRGAKGVAVGLNLAFAAFVSIQAVRWLSLLSIPLIIGWIFVVRYAGHAFKEHADEVPA